MYKHFCKTVTSGYLETHLNDVFKELVQQVNNDHGTELKWETIRAGNNSYTITATYRIDVDE